MTFDRTWKYKCLSQFSRARSEIPEEVTDIWVSRLWDREKAEKSRAGNLLVEQRMKTIDALEGLEGRLLVLEPGCGTGSISMQMAGLANIAHIVSWDVNTEALAIARHRASKGFYDSKLTLFNSPLTIESLEYASSFSCSLDATPTAVVIVALELLFHLPNAIEFIRAIPRLHPNTLLIGNFKTRKGLLPHSALNVGFPNASLRWVLANTIHRSSPSFWLSTGHSNGEILSAFEKWRDVTLSPNGFYEHVVAEM